jgi:hypothetical protein
LTAAQKIQHGHLFLLESTCVWTARRIIVIWEFTSRLSVQRISTVRASLLVLLFNDYSEFVMDLILYIDLFPVWQWDQLRLMKVGGNESATKFFRSHGGSAALASKDPSVKYTSNAAVKYKDELKRRAAADAKE